MKTRLKIIFPAVIAIVITVFSAYYISDRKKSSDIINIEIESQEQLFSEYNKYIIDFNNNTFTETEIKGGIEYEKITYFSDEAKENFVCKANMYGFFGWKELYEPLTENMCGGSYTEFKIKYSNGSNQKIYCSYDYPVTYYKFWESFSEIFGDCMIQEGDHENTV